MFLGKIWNVKTSKLTLPKIQLGLLETQPWLEFLEALGSVYTFLQGDKPREEKPCARIDTSIVNALPQSSSTWQMLEQCFVSVMKSIFSFCIHCRYIEHQTLCFTCILKQLTKFCWCGFFFNCRLLCIFLALFDPNLCSLNISVVFFFPPPPEEQWAAVIYLSRSASKGPCPDAILQVCLTEQLIPRFCLIGLWKDLCTVTGERRWESK